MVKRNPIKFFDDIDKAEDYFERTGREFAISADGKRFVSGTDKELDKFMYKDGGRFTEEYVKWLYGEENPRKRNLVKGRNNARAIKHTAGLGMALIASEHFFASMLTSPMTTKRFFSTSEEGIKDTMDALKKAVWLSLVSGVILSSVSRSWIPLVTTGAVSGFYWQEYTSALKGEI